MYVIILFLFVSISRDNTFIKFLLHKLHAGIIYGAHQSQSIYVRKNQQLHLHNLNYLQ